MPVAEDARGLFLRAMEEESKTTRMPFKHQKPNSNNTALSNVSHLCQIGAPPFLCKQIYISILFRFCIYFQKSSILVIVILELSNSKILKLTDFNKTCFEWAGVLFLFCIKRFYKFLEQWFNVLCNFWRVVSGQKYNLLINANIQTSLKL